MYVYYYIQAQQPKVQKTNTRLVYLAGGGTGDKKRKEIKIIGYAHI